MRARGLFDLAGKVAVVTGGSIGIGKLAAQGLMESEADVAICARNVERCEQTAIELAKIGKRILAIGCDVSNPDQVSVMFEKIVKEFGRVDILVNNAGIAWAASPEELQIADWEKVMKVNLTGTFLCSQAAGRIMIKENSGKIINITSILGLVGTDVIDSISYNTSKGGIVGFTKDLAVKWAKHRINVNAIAFSYAKTHLSEWVIDQKEAVILERTPLGRLLNENDIKGAVVFLASEASDYITGHVLCVDGGWTAQ